MPRYETVIGLEVHVQLATNSKLFCSCSTKFGQSPNSNVCPVCAAMPGTLPVMNQKAIEYAIIVGLATGCTIQDKSVFARKNYFYPDSPMGYQISQFELPICTQGHLNIDTSTGTKCIRITRIHLENDAGKNIHAPEQNSSFVDLNRAGTALIEIVSEPDLSSSDEAIKYLKALYSIVTYLEVCDGNMEEGSFRCDANVSIRLQGATELGTRTELKNLNSFRNVQKAIDYEIVRQQDILDEQGIIIQETRLYDSVKNITLSMRSKEEAHDYRYFPDPDLLPIHIDSVLLQKLQHSLPELPEAKSKRFIKEFSLNEADAGLLASDKTLAEFFEKAILKADARKICNFIMGALLRILNMRELSFKELKKSSFSPEAMAELVRIVDEGLISSKIANDIFADIFDSGQMPEAYVRQKGLVQISDSSELESIIDEVIKENPSEAEAFKGGKTKLISFFIGQIMRKTKGKANPALVNSLLTKKLS